MYLKSYIQVKNKRKSMDEIFHVLDKRNRKIHLSKERQNHIVKEHPEIANPEEIKQVLLAPTKILPSDRDDTVRWYFLYKKLKKRYLKVSVLC